ncbi:MAG TPA: hypothetical protein PLJ27_25305 [Polyangiaceae bacterium]|jgi:hypothetical protein|nr:hypothetical protein [Polyangiaceae bacterium]HOE49703.1 hypothetical protein [Polyangiaceae bacterium]HOH03060.1 hypothetical protein [Polyangiaceae bacterium]HPB95951.1 hypothetical protein [Polyangiaceae bacterium]HPK95437.1 hypothetical protein [Polyangiaceae bacterium]
MLWVGLGTVLAGCCKKGDAEESSSTDTTEAANATASATAVNIPFDVLSGYSDLKIPKGGKTKLGKKLGELNIEYPRNIRVDGQALVKASGFTITELFNKSLVYRAKLEKNGKAYKYSAADIFEKGSITITPMDI